MKQRDLFLMSDASMREVVDSLTPELLGTTVPAMWSRQADPTLRDILLAHIYDEAWIPDVLAGKTAEEVGDRWSGDLAGDDPIASYRKYNDAAQDFIMQGDLAETIHFSYGDYPLSEAFVHMSVYRAFQAWSIAKLIGKDFHLPPEAVDILWDEVVPNAEDWRAMGVFPPEVEVAADADKETRLLGKTGYLVL